MPFPLIPIIVVASSVLIGGATICKIVYHFANADVDIKPANYKYKADVTILFIGESEAERVVFASLIGTNKNKNMFNQNKKFK